MAQSRKKSDRKSQPRDSYELPGEASGNAVIIQGPEAHVDITHRDTTPAEIRRFAELADLDLLQRTIAAKIESFKKQIKPTLEKGHNPYRFGQALSFRETDLLAGRETLISNILERLKQNSYSFLAGNGGSGKTSLMQAGLMPQVFKQGDLPIFVPVTSDSLELNIKRQFLGEVTQTPYLSQVPLSTFLRHVTECLPATKHVYLFVDELEDFLAHAPSETASFKQEWLQSLTNSPRIHWQFSIHLGFSHLLNFFRPEINPFSELVILSPLDREDARQAILKVASITGIEIETTVSDDILDRLGGKNISPAELQTVCYLMAGGNGPVRLRWTLTDYESEGRADGIMRQSLERLIGQLKRGDRQAAWQVLAALMEHEGISFERLVNRLKPESIGSDDLDRLLKLLEEIHLIDVKDEQYYLASESMRSRIQQWVHEQNALVQARQEALYQLRQLRNSALRGLFGGALGFVLFDKLIYTGPIPDLSFFIFFLTQFLAIGSIAGFLLTLTVDLSIAAYHGSHIWLRYVVGSLGGIVAFSTALLLLVTNSYVGDSFLQILPSAVLEGALWGAIIGLGTTYALSSTRKAWLTVLVTALAGGLVLLGVELKLSVLVNELLNEVPSTLRIFLAGALVPFCYMTAALFRRSGLEKRGES
jgi:conflict system STAND superfamily ATPase